MDLQEIQQELNIIRDLENIRNDIDVDLEETFLSNDEHLFTYNYDRVKGYINSLNYVTIDRLELIQNEIEKLVDKEVSNNAQNRNF